MICSLLNDAGEDRSQLVTHDTHQLAFLLFGEAEGTCEDLDDPFRLISLIDDELLLAALTQVDL
jgi:hypothetical protein